MVDKTGRLRILIVEDDRDDVFLIKDLINDELRGSRIDVATNYDDALEKIETKPYDVCLFDYGLGEKNGLDLFRTVKDLDMNVPMIFLSGMGSESLAVKIMKSGVDDYIPKSEMTSKDLCASIRRAVRLKMQIDEVISENY